MYLRCRNSIMHSFVECNETQLFLNEVVSLFNTVHNCSLQPSPMEKLLVLSLEMMQTISVC